MEYDGMRMRFEHLPLSFDNTLFPYYTSFTMGWFSTTSPSSSSEKPATIDAPKPSHDGGFIAPDRSQRAKCWEGRDGFFACLDKNNIIDSVKNSEKAASLCGKEEQAFEKNCASSWVR